ncbi:radical SAM protein [Rhizobium sp. RAF36]|uniref:radical SAM protein n=1 Tax=Rhizobium sp. RAF36 TaxID=3233055 RepID=UPI003F968FA3
MVGINLDSRLQLVSGAISVTGACTIACRHCYSESSPKVSATHSLETLNDIVSTLKRYGVRQIFVGGGEPFLHPDLDRLVTHMFAEGVLPSVSSNGHGVTRERIAALYEAGMRYNMAISLDGPDDGINGRIRGPRSFYGTLLGMYELASFGKILWGVNYVCCQQNLGHALSTAKLAATLGASYFNCIKFTPSGRGSLHAAAMAVSDEEYANEILRVSEVYSPLGEYYDEIFVFDVRRQSTVVNELRMVDCAASYFSDFSFQNPLGISINHNGDVALAPPNIPLGNLSRLSLPEMLESINSPAVLEKYQSWLRKDWAGIHPPKSFSNRPAVSNMISSHQHFLDQG